jgi:uncharacterized damage-inducible protein DinB
MLSKQIAKHFRELYFGGNWTCSNFKDQLEDITWEESVSKISSLNTIAVLTHHVSYYVAAVLKVFEGEALNAKDELSFDHLAIQSQQDWELLRDGALDDAERLSTFIEQLPDEKWWDVFEQEKYGNYYRNINGIIEHTHYHLGQIALIKKMLRNKG